MIRQEIFSCNWTCMTRHHMTQIIQRLTTPDPGLCRAWSRNCLRVHASEIWSSRSKGEIYSWLGEQNEIAGYRQPSNKSLCKVPQGPWRPFKIYLTAILSKFPRSIQRKIYYRLVGRVIFGGPFIFSPTFLLFLVFSARAKRRCEEVISICFENKLLAVWSVTGYRRPESPLAGRVMDNIVYSGTGFKGYARVYRVWRESL